MNSYNKNPIPTKKETRHLHVWEICENDYLCFDSATCSVYSSTNISSFKSLINQPNTVQPSNTYSPLKHNFTKNYHPAQFVFCLTDACNLNCEYCYQGEYHGDNREGALKIEDALKNVDILAKSKRKGVKTIIFFGGEPLLEKGLLKEIVLYCEKEHPNVKWAFSMTTNGTLLDEDIFNFIKKRNFSIMVSLDGPPGSGLVKTSKETIENIRIAEELAPNTISSIRVTLGPKKPPDLISLVDFFENLGIKRIYVALASLGTVGTKSLYNWSSAKDLWISEFNRYSDYCISFFIKNKRFPYFMPFAKAFKMYLTGEIFEHYNPYIPCGIYRGMVAVGQDGNYYPCHRFVGMKSAIIGYDLFSESYSKFVSDKLNQYGNRDVKCKSCWCNPLCHGGCPHDCVDNNMEFKSELTDDYCDIVRSLYENMFKIIYKIMGNKKLLLQKGIIREQDNCFRLSSEGE